MSEGPGEALRLFFAVELAEELREGVVRVQEGLQRAQTRVKWVEPENLHFTLKFLGDMPADLVDRLCAVAADVAARQSPFEITLRGAGAFPKPDHVRVAWIGVSSGGPQFEALWRDLDGSLAAARLAERDSKPFRAHLTIGRVKGPQGARELGPLLREAQQTPIGTMAVTRFSLIRSELRREGPLYTPLGAFDLRP